MTAQIAPALGSSGPEVGDYLSPASLMVALRAWLVENKIKTIYIEPGSTWQNGYIESFNARLRPECLNRAQRWR